VTLRHNKAIHNSASGRASKAKLVEKAFAIAASLRLSSQ